ncbi:MAG: substrate-binding domain-containing protein [Clostridiales Family XIII bacterium]|jgi:ribose transport system substrate-binding protein|nr:substrate-binding domain-containing protein [Clostridiales Family XIII bacterium]
MKKKLLLALVLVLIAVTALSGCGSNDDSSADSDADTTPAEDTITIGFSQCTMASPFYVSHVDAAKEEADALGVELVVADADEDVTKQNQDIADMLEKGIDVLILNAVDPDGVAPSLAKCAEKNVPIITVDRFVNGDVAVIVGRDNEVMGQAVGEAIVAALGGKGAATGKILEVMGSGGDRVQEARSKGFHNAVDAESGIEVVQTPYCDYVRSKAATATQDIIQQHKDFDMIYGHNDDMALGALQVMEDAGLNVQCSGVDGLMEAVEAIKDGRYLATSANDPYAFGRLAVQVAVKLANGETVGEYEDAGTFLVDKSNVDEYFNADLAFATKPE